MPPTNFFNRLTKTNSPMKIWKVFWSIYGLVCTSNNRALSKQTRESCFSSKYYNSFLAYPLHRKRLAVSLHRVNGVYSKGRKNNPIEAQAVVKEVVRSKDEELSNSVLVWHWMVNRCNSWKLAGWRTKEKSIFRPLLMTTEPKNPSL